ncbi:hypothetical protein MRX96_021119 [Rhipicephalus microplus]
MARLRGSGILSFFYYFAEPKQKEVGEGESAGPRLGFARLRRCVPWTRQREHSCDGNLGRGGGRGEGGRLSRGERDLAASPLMESSALCKWRHRCCGRRAASFRSTHNHHHHHSPTVGSGGAVRTTQGELAVCRAKMEARSDPAQRLSKLDVSSMLYSQL